MDSRLNGKSEIWADGYSFMEVTETLLMALGIRSDDRQAERPSHEQAEPATASSSQTAPCADITN